ncbi:hypothetical protein OJ996_20040 [Luteolibacter sp. GHJ8]|uniref:Uncharacterized protein n=1 Tax=Luteolibacter rhizosphaerae TaxID=2989719 RepID=A0ABT3G7R4_9BACT|nr:hypothetical protein [Luteolibacter rhizosphaerae]MCW1915889.1 hypothetical protein [Luteolibacter rhizosphaerae]
MLVLDPRFNGSIESSAGLIARQEREIVRLTREVAMMETRFESYQQRKSQATTLAGYLKQAADFSARSADLSRQIEDAGKSLDRIQSRRARHAEAYREHIRAKAVGETLPTMNLTDGRVLESPRIIKVTPAGLQLRYSAGIVRVPVKDLPFSVRQRFQFSEEEAAEFLTEERGQVAEFEREIDQDLEIINEANLRRRKDRLEEKIPRLRERIETFSNQLAEQRRLGSPHLRTIIDLQDRIALDRRALSQAESELRDLSAGEQ